MKNRYFIEIAYNGSNYHGWQVQSGSITVQQILNEHISMMLGETINCLGCGRTDAGVHARKFFFHLDTTMELSSEFVWRLNHFLPKDINVKKIYTLSKKISARWDANRRSYEYLICAGKDPFLIGLAVTINDKLDLEAMNEAAGILLEYKDFESFSKSQNSHNHYLCDLYEARWERDGKLLRFNITANRFVRSMVRLIVGSMLEVGRGRISTEDFRAIIEARNRLKSGKAAPAHGLYLVDVQYPEGILIEMN